MTVLLTVLSFPPLRLSSTRGLSAAALLSSPTTQRAIGAVETVAAARDALARRGGYGGGTAGDDASRTSSAHLAAAARGSSAKLRVACLRVALQAATDEAHDAGALGPASWRRCARVFASLASLWAHARDADAEREKEAH